MQMEEALRMLRTRMSGARAAAVKANVAPDFSGDWRNQLASTMTLTVNGSSVSGNYTSVVSGGGGAATGELVGFVNGDLISFAVNWDPIPAITAWVGQMVQQAGADAIFTLWHLTMNVPDADEPTGMWQSIVAGTDTFQR